MTPEDEWMSKRSASVVGGPSMCGQHVSAGGEAISSPQGECSAIEAHNDRHRLKSAALAAAGAALGITELPDPATFRTTSFLPMIGSEASVAPLVKSKVQASTNLTEDRKEDAGSKLRTRKEFRCSKRRSSPFKQGSCPSQLTQSEIDANWDAL